MKLTFSISALVVETSLPGTTSAVETTSISTMNLTKVICPVTGVEVRVGVGVIVVEVGVKVEVGPGRVEVGVGVRVEVGVLV